MALLSISKAYFCVLIGEDDGVCVICKQKPPSDDVVLCNTCAPKTTSDAPHLDHCSRCCSLQLLANREMMNEIESVKEQGKVMKKKDGNDREEESSNKRRKEEQPLICVFNRQQTFDEFLEDNDDVDA